MYRGIVWLLLGLLLVGLISYLGLLAPLLPHIEGLGYLGIILAGALFIFLFTATAGALLLTALAISFTPVEVALLGGLGAALGDSLIFKLVRRQSHSKQKHGRGFRLFRYKYVHWLLPGLGAVIIASPLPDELGVSLMGVSNLKTRTFFLLAFLLNALGIFALIQGYSFLSGL